MPRAPALSGFVGQDPAILSVLHTLRLVADTDATVLITGETGTGKEVMAQALHEHSSRRPHAFVAVNCGALPESLLESELFGHLRGAFTGATDARLGKFEAANGGTIFLDEVADMPPALQVKLLRVLQTGEYAPVGSSSNRTCNVRVVGATNQPLKPLVAAGKVRADLYYRLNVICLELPPLRARRTDILPIASHFLHKFADAYRRLPRRFSADASELLLGYRYPGNVRELENIVRRAVLLASSECIGVEDLPAELREDDNAAPEAPVSGVLNFEAARSQVLESFERRYLISVLQECGGIVSRAAGRAAISERNFHAKLKKHGLHGRDFRGGRRAG